MTLDDAAERRIWELAEIACESQTVSSPSFVVDMVVAGMRMVWQEATEAAAKKCDDAADNHHGLGSAESACLYCADSIRGKD